MKLLVCPGVYSLVIELELRSNKNAVSPLNPKRRFPKPSLTAEAKLTMSGKAKLKYII